MVYDGDYINARIIGKYCISNLTKPIVSTSDRMFMAFFSLYEYGFEAEYSSGKGAIY